MAIHLPRRQPTALAYPTLRTPSWLRSWKRDRATVRPLEVDGAQLVVGLDRVEGATVRFHEPTDLDPIVGRVRAVHTSASVGSPIRLDAMLTVGLITDVASAVRLRVARPRADTSDGDGILTLDLSFEPTAWQLPPAFNRWELHLTAPVCLVPEWPAQ